MTLKSKGKEVLKPPKHSFSSIATMSTMDLKGLDNTSRIPKPIQNKSNSKKEIGEEKDFDVESKAKSSFSPTISQMANSYPDI